MGRPVGSKNRPANKKGAKAQKLLGVTQAEFARLDGCSPSYVQRAVATRVLPELEDGSIDPALVGSGWRSENQKKIERREAAERRERGEADPTLEGSLDVEGGLLDTKAAERIQATYKALKEKRLHDQAIGLVVLVDDAARKVATAYAKVRTKMLSIAPEHAAQLAILKTPAEVKEYLERQITRALEALVEDDG